MQRSCDIPIILGLSEQPSHQQLEYLCPTKDPSHLYYPTLVVTHVGPGNVAIHSPQSHGKHGDCKINKQVVVGRSSYRT